MSIDRKMLEYLSNLSRISLQEEEKEKLIKDLNSLEKLVEKIQEVDTASVAEKFSILENNHLSLRKDVIRNSLDFSHIQKLAPSFKKRKFIVPQVIE